MVAGLVYRRSAGPRSPPEFSQSIRRSKIIVRLAVCLLEGEADCLSAVRKDAFRWTSVGWACALAEICRSADTPFTQLRA